MRTLTIAVALCTLTALCAHAADPAEREAACKAKAFHKWSGPHKAGEISPSTGKAYVRDSGGACRLDQKAVRAAIVAGAIKPN